MALVLLMFVMAVLVTKADPILRGLKDMNTIPVETWGLFVTKADPILRGLKDTYV